MLLLSLKECRAGKTLRQKGYYKKKGKGKQDVCWARL